jgi:hypothetical protein
MACGVCARSTRRAASLPGEGSTHLRGCGMTAVGAKPTFRKHQRLLSVPTPVICSVPYIRHSSDVFWRGNAD